MSYVIRAAQATDAPQLAALQAHCNSRRMATSRARQRTRSANFEQRTRRSTLTLVCEQEGTLLGFVTATVHPLLPFAGLEKTAWSIIEFCVSRQETEDNVGAALLQEIGRKAKENAGYVDVLW